jgi:hypothetical protein
MTLLIYYTALSLAGFTAAAFICLGIEEFAPWASMPIFLTMFFAVLWVAWIAAVKMTEPKVVSAPAVGATSDQRA